MPRIPYPGQMPREYLYRYYKNWWWLLSRRRPFDVSWVGACIWCGSSGILGFDLIHTGVARSTNLFCWDCIEDIDIDENTATGTDTKKVVDERRVQAGRRAQTNRLGHTRRRPRLHN